MGLSVVDAIIVSGYLTAMLALGWYSRRQSAESYWVAERSKGTAAIALSLVATVFGASSTLGVIGLGYARGLTGAWWSLIGGLALLLFGLTLAARVRALSVYTLPDILRSAYGDRVAVPAALMIVISWCGIVSAQMVAGARLLDGVVPMSYEAALTVIALVFVLYTYWGGQLSVIRTDAWQLLLFAAGLLVCFGLVALSLQGSQLSLSDSVPAAHLEFPVSAGFAWYDLLVFYPLVVGLPYLVGPDIYSRVLCARDNSVAKRAALSAALAIIPISLLLALVGILIRARFPDIAPESALPTVLGTLMPVGIAGLVAAGFLAAVMSSADTTLVSAATILSLNVVSIRGRASLGRQLAVTRLGVLGVGVCAWLIAWFQQGIIASLLLGYTVFVGGVVFPTLASFWKGRLPVTSTGAMWAVVVGGCVAVLGAVHQGALLRALLGESGDSLLTHSLGREYRSILPIVLSVIVMLAVSAADRRGLARIRRTSDGEIANRTGRD